MAANSQPDYDKPGDEGEERVKVICLGDSAVGKSKLVERFLMDGYKPQQLSTFALTLFNHKAQIDGKTVSVDFWDTAGQERFNSMHPSYYHQAHACVLVFDCTRKITYKNLPEWLKDLRQYRPEIPCLCAANKIDEDMDTTKKSFAFAKKNNMPFYYVSAADGTNVVRLFKDSIRAALAYKNNSTDFMDEIMKELEMFELDPIPRKVKDKKSEDTETNDKAETEEKKANGDDES